MWLFVAKDLLSISCFENYQQGKKRNCHGTALPTFIDKFQKFLWLMYCISLPVLNCVWNMTSLKCRKKILGKIKIVLHKENTKKLLLNQTFMDFTVSDFIVRHCSNHYFCRMTPHFTRSNGYESSSMRAIQYEIPRLVWLKLCLN